MNAEVLPKRAPRTSIAPIATDLTPAQMLSVAVQQGADLDRIQKFMDLKDRWEATEARNGFVRAMSAFKAEPIKILKTKKADIPGGAKYNYASLADVYDGALSEMSKHGLSHRFETKQEQGLITVTCIVTHEMGHSERVTLSAPPDETGKKSPIQQIASTVHYLERYTFLAATGLASKEVDNDGRGPLGGKQPQTEEPPAGYDHWHADMVAVADEGFKRLTEAWEKTDPKYRRYVIKFDEPWWDDMKARAKKATKSAEVMK